MKDQSLEVASTLLPRYLAGKKWTEEQRPHVAALSSYTFCEHQINHLDIIVIGSNILLLSSYLYSLVENQERTNQLLSV